MEAAYRFSPHSRSPPGPRKTGGMSISTTASPEPRPVTFWCGTRAGPFVTSSPDRSGGSDRRRGGRRARLRRRPCARFSDLDSDPGSRGWFRLITTNWPRPRRILKGWGSGRIEVGNGHGQSRWWSRSTPPPRDGYLFRLQVVVGENARSSVLVDYRSADGARLSSSPGRPGGSRQWTVAISLGPGPRSRRDHGGASESGAGPRPTSRIGEVGLGARLGRLDLGVSLVGDGSSSEVVGLYLER